MTKKILLENDLRRILLVIIQCFLLFSCEVLKQKVCSDEGYKDDDHKKAEAAAPEPEEYTFLYSRAKFIENPTLGALDQKFLHMCWYRADASQKFMTASAFELALQADPKVAKIETMYAFFTPATLLSKKLRGEIEANPSKWTSFEIAKNRITLGELDRISMGQSTSIHAAAASLVALTFFGGDFLQPKNGEGELTVRSVQSEKAVIDSKVSALLSLSDQATAFLNQQLRNWGTNSPEESILRLPLSILTEISCPEY